MTTFDFDKEERQAVGFDDPTSIIADNFRSGQDISCGLSRESTGLSWFEERVLRQIFQKEQKYRLIKNERGVDA